MAKDQTLKKNPFEEDELITLTKDDEVIRAHPDQVALWKKQGWTEVAAEEADHAE